MKIVLTGGGSGGHFYPIIAVAQAVRKIAREEKLVDVELYYMAPQPYDKQILYDLNIQFVKCTSGKLRRYFSVMNMFDIIRTGWGVTRAMGTMLLLYPDVVFGKGGYVSFPALFAARFYRIPVIIHESDSVPGRLNRWAGKFAQKIAVSFPQAAEFFDKSRVANTGQPIRQELLNPIREGAHEFLKLERIPTILILGGSQGAQVINENLVNALPKLVEKYNVIHQAGKTHLHLAQETAKLVLEKSEHKDRYRPFDHLDTQALRMAAGAADLIISRAGSTIFEIASWGVPAILIPITDSNGDHQRKNAYNYARSGAAVVVEESNLTSNILASEVDRLLGDQAQLEKMRQGAASFARRDAAELIAKEILAIAVQHEK